jgi:hypothetical protein
MLSHDYQTPNLSYLNQFGLNVRNMEALGPANLAPQNFS